MNEFPVKMTGTTNTLLWAQEHSIEPQALEQLRTIAALPEVAALRVMPDVHFGKGATVGSVIAMRRALAPAAVGVDIGCGVAAVKTNLAEHQLADLPALRSQIEQLIPVGFNRHTDDVAVQHFGTLTTKLLLHRFNELRADVTKHEERAMSQCGTLGGGNHFIELCADEHGAVWLTLHSGSRGIGKELAEKHITKAKGLEHNAAYGDMAVFHGGTTEMDDYMHDLRWAQAYAAESRAIMLNIFKQTVLAHFAQRGHTTTFLEEINVHHNYVAMEVVDGELATVTRKGAIRAGHGELALIPGSMGTGSYVVRGLGSAASLQSASHGAGRRMSRNQAKKRYTTDDLVTQTQGIECRKDAGIVDEIPAAYKSISEVIAAQSDLIQPVAHLRTLLCVKG